MLALSMLALIFAVVASLKMKRVLKKYPLTSSTSLGLGLRLCPRMKLNKLGPCSIVDLSDLERARTRCLLPLLAPVFRLRKDEWALPECLRVILVPPKSPTVKNTLSEDCILKPVLLDPSQSKSVLVIQRLGLRFRKSGIG